MRIKMNGQIIYRNLPKIYLLILMLCFSVVTLAAETNQAEKIKKVAETKLLKPKPSSTKQSSTKRSTAKKVATKRIVLPQVSDPFDTRTLLQKKLQTNSKNFKQRLLSKESLAIISDKIKIYKQSIDQLNQKKALASKAKVKPEITQFSFSKLTFDSTNKNIRLHDVVDGSSGLYKGFEDRTIVKKYIDFLWFDIENEDPHFLRTVINDKITIQPEFLKKRRGNEIQRFLSQLRGTNKSSDVLNNRMEMAFDFDENKGDFSLALSSLIDESVNIKIITKLEGYTRLLHHRLLQPTLNKGAEILLPLISTLKMKELYVRFKLEKSIDEVIQALPAKESQQMKEQYQAYKSMTPEIWNTSYGKIMTNEQFINNRQAIVNFLEKKQALVFRAKFKKAELVSSLATYFILAKTNPKIFLAVLGGTDISLVNE